MNHQKIVWTTILCLAVTLGILYYALVFTKTTDSPVIPSTPTASTSATLQQNKTDQTLNSLKSTSTTSISTTTQQKTINSLKSSSASSKTTTQSPPATNKTLDSLKAH